MNTFARLFINYLLAAIGLFQIFKKININAKWAFVPILRYCKIGEYVEMEEETSTFLIFSVLSNALSFTGLYLSQDITHVERRYILLVCAMLISAVVTMIYTFRIMAVFGMRMRNKHKTSWFWTLLWIIYPCIPALIWGFSKKFKPAEVETDSSEGETTTASISGTDVPVLKKGLTVNLKERTVKSHMKKRTLLRDIHLNIKPGTMVLLLGGSGAGKTTFINAVNGYEPADAKVYLDGEEVYTNFNKMKYNIGFVPQQDLIRYEDTVRRTLMDEAALRLPNEVTREQKTARVKEVLDIFGLSSVKDNLVARQSGGQKKRISIAMEFISDPSLFILDEPDSGLDGILARDLMQRLHEISRQGKIVIVITHTPDRVIDLFDQVIVLGKDADRTGRLVFHGSIDDARTFFEVERMEEIVRKINCKDEGGEGLADTLIEKFAEVRHE